MPIDYKKYPEDWLTRIRPAVLERANNCCEECKVENHAVGARDLSGKWHSERSINCLNSDAGFFLFGDKFPKIIKIVLTIAHLDHDADNKDIKIERLRAWCQRCHLNYDRPRHIANRKKNFNKKHGIQTLF